MHYGLSETCLQHVFPLWNRHVETAALEQSLLLYSDLYQSQSIQSVYLAIEYHWGHIYEFLRTEKANIRQRMWCGWSIKIRIFTQIQLKSLDWTLTFIWEAFFITSEISFFFFTKMGLAWRQLREGNKNYHAFRKLQCIQVYFKNAVTVFHLFLLFSNIDVC